VKISILVTNLSRNPLVRVYPIAKVLQRQHDVEVIGPQVGESVFLPYAEEFQYRSFPYAEYGHFWKVLPRILDAISGDLIYTFKPRPACLYPALIKKLRSRLPLLLDIEDWEVGWSIGYEGDVWGGWRHTLKHPKSSIWSPTSFLHLALCEQLARLADQITVVSRWLQQRFGGIRLVHGVDPAVFDPVRYDSHSIKESMGFSGKKMVLFTGWPMPHKGVGELLEAVHLVGSDRLRLVIVGGDPEHPFLRSLMERGGNSLVWMPYQPHSRMPQMLCMADYVVLPQRRTPIAQAQIPGKLFEAMAMARPIIATNVSDLPEILDDTGCIVEPERPEEIAEVLARWLKYPDEAEEMGRRARLRCVSDYSYDAMEVVLTNVLSKL